MRYEILGFNQQKVIEAELDMTDLLILDYIIQANGDPVMEHIVKDGIAYVWINHLKFLEDYPILPISEGTFRNRLSDLKKRGFILVHTERLVNGAKSYYSVTCLSMSFKNDIRCHSGMTSDNSISPYISNTSLSNISNIGNTNKQELILEDNKEDTYKIKAQKFVDDYNEICVSLPKCKRITPKRSKAISNIIKKFSYEDILEVFHNLEESDFCTGRNNRGWKADIDFILREDKFVSTLEGKYNNKTSGVEIKSGGPVRQLTAEEKERIKKNGTKF